MIFLWFIWLSYSSSQDVIGYKLKISLTTTSDWTHFFFEGAGLSIYEGEIIHSAAYPAVRGTKIWKEKRTDSSEVKILYKVKLVPEKDTFSLIILKGNLGRTIVSLISKDGEEYPFINSSIIEGDLTNRVRFSIPVNRFKECEEKMKLKFLTTPKYVLAFYYPWYGTSEPAPGGRWKISNTYTTPREPTLRYYNSIDTCVIKNHMEWARQNGIDGFIVSWWGIGSYSDTVAQKLFDMVEATPLKMSVYYERANSSSEVIRDIKYLHSTYGEKKAFLGTEGKPVIFYYTRVVDKFSIEEWESIFRSLRQQGINIYNIADSFDPLYLNVFDGIHIYNPTSEEISYLTFLYHSLALAAGERRKLFAGTVAPGYDDRFLRSPGIKIERENGKYYKSLWELAIQSYPTWILITSFNEWQEGTEIEPSKEFGNTYLQITKEYVNKFKNR